MSQKRPLTALFCWAFIVSAAPVYADERTARIKRARSTAKMIDARIDQAMARAKLQPAPRSDRYELIRRLSLDLNGLIPTTESLKTHARSADVAKYVETLLEDDRYGEHLSNVLTRAFVGRKRDAAAVTFRGWLKKRISRGQAFDQMVRDILESKATKKNARPQGAAYFFLRWQQKTEDVAAQSARAFMGLQIQCAQCHDHPFNDWKQEQFHQYAAYFSRAPYSYKLQSGQSTVFQPRFLFSIELQSPKNMSPQKTIARLITHPENPYFARMTVNRIWKMLFGRGLIEPIEDLESQPGDHPRLLNFLAQDFISQGFDLRHLIRSIVLSRSYQRSSKRAAEQSNPGPESEKPGAMGAHKGASQRLLKAYQEVRLFARATLRPLSPEQIVDSLLRATGRERLLMRGSSRARKLNRIRFNYLKNKLHLQFEQLTDDQEAKPDIFEGTIPQALILLNGRFVNEAIEAEDGTFMESLLRSGNSGNVMLKRLFRTALSRPPSKEEMKTLGPLLKHRSARPEALEDLMWAMINSPEWLLNH
jgi:hypothetical protein